MVEEQNFVIHNEHVGMRLFDFLRKQYSVRTARSFIRYHNVYVNGKFGSKSYILQRGDVIQCKHSTYSSFSPTVLMSTKDYIAIYKPHNIHSAHIAGKPTLSIESVLREHYEFHKLCTRLDYETSGILIVAKNKSSYRAFREHEKQGSIEKVYIAIVEGRCPVMSIENALFTAKTTKTKVLSQRDVDCARHTHIITTQPMTIYDLQCSTVTCKIYRGARHQIRTHLAHQGFPIVGDYKYGAKLYALPFFLHNTCICLFDEYIQAPLPDFWNMWTR